MAPFCLALLNETPASHSPLAAELTAAWLAQIAAALQTQLREHIAPVWSYATDAVCRVCAGPTDLGLGEVPMRYLPELPDAPGAIAYHDDAGGYPDEFLGLDTCSGLDEVGSATSHENAEVCGDPNCDQWAAITSGPMTGKELAYELCDPLQDRSYRVGGMLVSDFVYPAYFDPGLKGPTSYGEDKLGSPRLEPFARTSGGYQIVRNADGTGETQVFGAIPPLRYRRAHHASSRLAKRGIHVTQAHAQTLTRLFHAEKKLAQIAAITSKG